MIPCSQVKYELPMPMAPIQAAETLCPAHPTDLIIDQVIDGQQDMLRWPALVIESNCIPFNGNTCSNLP